MGLEEVTLSASTIATVNLDAPTGRVVVTQISGTAAVIYATCDGSNPVIPSSGVEVPGGQQVIASVTGGQAVLQPPLFGDHMQIPQIRLLSAGTPGVTLTW